MLVLFHEHYKISYLPRGMASLFFYFLCILIVFVAPVFIGLAMSNFWVEHNIFYQKPSVAFTNRCALKYTTILGQTKLWTCSDYFNSEFLSGDEREVIPYFSLYMDDENSDGKVDIITIILGVPINPLNSTLTTNTYTIPSNMEMDAIETIEFLPEFTYSFDHYVAKLNMTAAPYLIFQRAPYYGSHAYPFSISYTNPPTCALTEVDFLFYSTEPLISSPFVHYFRTYTNSPLENMTDTSVLMDLASFAKAYTGRNQSVMTRKYAEAIGGPSLLKEQYKTLLQWEDLGSLDSFTWKIVLRVQKAKVEYVPSYAEALKWVWVQYFCIAYALQWLTWRLRGTLVKLGLIGSTALFYRKVGKE